MADAEVSGAPLMARGRNHQGLEQFAVRAAFPLLFMDYPDSATPCIPVSKFAVPLPGAEMRDASICGERQTICARSRGGTPFRGDLDQVLRIWSATRRSLRLAAETAGELARRRGRHRGRKCLWACPRRLDQGEALGDRLVGRRNPLEVVDLETVFASVFDPPPGSGGRTWGWPGSHSGSSRRMLGG